jgi:hypothetical protein
MIDTPLLLSIGTFLLIAVMVYLQTSILFKLITITSYMKQLKEEKQKQKQNPFHSFEVNPMSFFMDSTIPDLHEFHETNSEQPDDVTKIKVTPTTADENQPTEETTTNKEL